MNYATCSFPEGLVLTMNQDAHRLCLLGIPALWAVFYIPEYL